MAEIRVPRPLLGPRRRASRGTAVAVALRVDRTSGSVVCAVSVPCRRVDGRVGDGPTEVIEGWQST
jgi:hypothetical protein